MPVASASPPPPKATTYVEVVNPDGSISFVPLTGRRLLTAGGEKHKMPHPGVHKFVRLLTKPVLAARRFLQLDAEHHGAWR